MADRYVNLSSDDLSQKESLFEMLTHCTEQGYEVVCFLADVGQEEDWDAVKAKAVQIGAKKMYVIAFHAPLAKAHSLLTTISQDH